MFQNEENDHGTDGESATIRDTQGTNKLAREGWWISLSIFFTAVQNHQLENMKYCVECGNIIWGTDGDGS